MNMNFNQLLFAISNKTEEYTYGSLAICYTNKLSMYKHMNTLRHVNDEYSATVLSICDCILRNDIKKMQELVDYYSKEWEFVK